MNLLRFNIWRKCILAGFALLVVLMFTIDWGYHFNVGHIVRMGVAAIALWLAVDRL